MNHIRLNIKTNKMKKILLVTACSAFLLGCKTRENITNNTKPQPVFDTEAHRGGRGLMPENTIPAMIDAIDRDVVTLELDLQISKDKKVIVSHDPYFNDKITTTPEGKFLTTSEAKKRLLYTMTYDSIRKYDVGIKNNPDFPQKKSIAASKPLLSDLIKASEEHAHRKGKSMLYNIEIKSSQKGDNINHPPVEEFVTLAIKTITDNGIRNRTVVQSFDTRALQIIHNKYPDIKTSLLVSKKDNESVKQQFETLGFIPHTYSPEYTMVTDEMIQYCHSLNVKILPWTVNTISEIKRLKDMNVDGIISDYPNLFKEL